MVVSALHRKLFRDLWKAKAQYLAVAAVIFVGVILHVSMFGAMENLVLTRDTYLREYRFADIFFHVERAPRSVVNKVQALDGVVEARGRIVRDVNLDVPGNPDPAAGRLVSLPWPRHAMLCDIHIAQGRYPGERTWNEVLVNPKFFKANDLAIGDELKATVDNRKYTLRIVGTALSPEYIYVIRDAASFMPDEKGFGLIYATQEFAETAFGMSGAVNDVVVQCADKEQAEDVKRRVEEVLDPYGLTLKVLWTDQLSYSMLKEEIKGLKDSVDVVPPIFQIVAALVIFIMLQRMVRAQRTQIGVLKAFGYSDAKIGIHYLEFAVVACIAGALPGLFVGHQLAGLMLQIYTQFFQFPLLKNNIYPRVYGNAFLMSLVICSVAGLLATRSILSINPAESMRPLAPAKTGAIWLERLGFLWSRLSFSSRLIVRNIFRHKGRSAFTLVGISLSCVILFIAFSFKDSLEFIATGFVKKTQQQDARVMFHRPQRLEAVEDLRGMSGVSRAEALLEVPYDFRNGWRKKTALVTGIERDSRLKVLIDETGAPVPLPEEGILLGKRLASALQIRRGDRLFLEALYPGQEETSVRVSGVFEDGVGLNAYMDLHALSRLLGEVPAANAANLALEPGQGEAVKQRLKDVGGVASVLLAETFLKAFDKQMTQSMNAMIVMFILFAGVISFAIIFNSATIAVAERSRELASLRVLGFTQREVSGLLFGEYYLLTAVGIAPGIWLGYHLARATTQVYATDFFRMPFRVYGHSYLLTAGFVVLFAVAAGIAGGRKIRKLDMVEALKARE